MEIKLPYQLTISIESMAKFPLEKNTALLERGADRARYCLMIMFCKFRAKNISLSLSTGHGGSRSTIHRIWIQQHQYDYKQFDILRFLVDNKDLNVVMCTTQ